MIETFLTLLAIGYASAYSPGVFEEVIRVRQSRVTAKHLYEISNDVQGYIAVADCDLIGNKVVACFEDECRRLLVADCANPNDGTLDWMRNSGIIGEVDWDTFTEFKEAAPLEMKLYTIQESKYKFK